MATELSGPGPRRPLKPRPEQVDHTPVAVLFALRREAMYFLRRFRMRGEVRGAPCRVSTRGDGPQSVLVLETGVGAAAMEAALTWLLGTPGVGEKSYRPRAVICAGFSGALRPGLAVGDLLLADEVADEHGGRWPTTWPGRPLPPFSVPVATGRLLAAGRLVTEPAAKLGLGQLHDAAAVDMETAAVARLCTQHGVPFGCLRAVSDDGATALSPALADVLRGGGVAPGALASAVLRRPGLVRELVRLAGDTRRAARRLADGLAALLAAHGGDVVGGEGTADRRRALSPGR